MYVPQEQSYLTREHLQYKVLPYWRGRFYLTHKRNKSILPYGPVSWRKRRLGVSQLCTGTTFDLSSERGRTVKIEKGKLIASVSPVRLVPIFETTKKVIVGAKKE